MVGFVGGRGRIGGGRVLLYVCTVIVAILVYVYYFDMIDYLEKEKIESGISSGLFDTILLVIFLVVFAAMVKTGLLIAAGLQMEFDINDEDEFLIAAIICFLILIVYILGIKSRAKQRVEKDLESEDEHHE